MNTKAHPANRVGLLYWFVDGAASPREAAHELARGPVADLAVSENLLGFPGVALSPPLGGLRKTLAASDTLAALAVSNAFFLAALVSLPAKPRLLDSLTP